MSGQAGRRGVMGKAGFNRTLAEARACFADMDPAALEGLLLEGLASARQPAEETLERIEREAERLLLRN